MSGRSSIRSSIYAVVYIALAWEYGVLVHSSNILLILLIVKEVF